MTINGMRSYLRQAVDQDGNVFDILVQQSAESGPPAESGRRRVTDRAECPYFSHSLRGHEDEVWSVAFSPDGQRLASGSEDMMIRIWIARTEPLTEMVCEQVWRNLTWDEWRRFVGTDLPYERTCPNQPPGRGTPLEAPAPRSPESARRVPASNNAEARVMGFAPAD